MKLILSGTVALAILLLLVLWLTRLAWRKAQGKPTRWSWRGFVLQTAIALLLGAVCMPVLLGYAGSRLVGTRPDEQAYRGPTITEGEWQLQSRQSLRNTPPADNNPHQIELQTEDGVRLFAYLVPAPVAARPRASVILVHGLFRSALELEPVAQMFHSLGCEVLMLESRNHGRSDTRPFSYGYREHRDVLAAAAYWRAHNKVSERPAPPLVLFGVSMGTALVALAAPQVPELAGLVLDAPMENLRRCAGRMLQDRFRMPAWIASLVQSSIEFWSNFEMQDVDVETALRQLRQPGLVALVVGAGEDRSMPPDVVRQVYAALPLAADRKVLWLQPDARHGRVWLMAQDDYRKHLKDLLHRIR